MSFLEIQMETITLNVQYLEEISYLRDSEERISKFSLLLSSIALFQLMVQFEPYWSRKKVKYHKISFIWSSQTIMYLVQARKVDESQPFCFVCVRQHSERFEPYCENKESKILINMNLMKILLTGIKEELIVWLGSCSTLWFLLSEIFLHWRAAIITWLDHFRWKYWHSIGKDSS